MENTATDYKKLYEQELEAHKKSLLAISKKEDVVLSIGAVGYRLFQH